MTPLGKPSDLLTMREVAGRLHVSLRWLQDFLKTRPHGRKAGRNRLFTPADFDALAFAVKQLSERLGLPK